MHRHNKVNLRHNSIKHTLCRLSPFTLCVEAGIKHIHYHMKDTESETVGTPYHYNLWMISSRVPGHFHNKTLQDTYLQESRKTQQVRVATPSPTTDN